jgi:Ca2+-transporting ATPase
MASDDDLDIPQIAVVGVQDDTFGPTLDALPSTSLENSYPLSPIGHASSSSDMHGFLSLPTPILRNSRNSLDLPASPASHTSDASSLHPPPSPTLSARSSGSIRWATSTVLRDNNPEDHDGLSSLGLLAPPSQGHRRKGSTGTISSIGSSSTDRDIEDVPGLGLSTVRSGHSDAPSTLPSPTNTHVDAGSDTSRPSSPASFFKRTVQRVRHPSPSPSGDTDMGSDTTRNDSVQRGDNADVKRKGAELARPALLDLKQEADLNVEPFAFKPLQLASLVDPKSLENLESLGGVEGLLLGLGTNRLHGLNTKLTPSSQLGSPDPGNINAVTPYGVEMSPPKPNIMITSPAGVHEGLQSTASLGGGSGVGRPASGAHEATVEDRQRIYGHNILPQRPSKSLLSLVWLALQDKVIVSPKIPHPFPCI